MLIYNKQWLDNLLIRESVHESFARGDLTGLELAAIENSAPCGFYSPNIFVRSGLLALTCIIAAFSGGLFGLLIYELSATICFLILGIAAYFVLEKMVRGHHHYRSGVDDALLWISAGFFLATFTELTETFFRTHVMLENFAYPLFVLALSFYLTLRFADMLMAVLCYFAMLTFLSVAWAETLPWGTATLPFLIIFLSAGAYFAFVKMIHTKKLRYYRQCTDLLRTISLFTFYLAGNVYVIEQFGNEILYGEDRSNRELPLPYFFWAWTVILPFLYITFAIKKKDQLLLRAGLILFAAAALTTKNYCHVENIEILLVLSGIVLLAIAWLLIRYLKTPKNGFTYQELEDGTSIGNSRVESLIISNMPGDTPQASGSPFGGGSFGGGGSSGNF